MPRIVKKHKLLTRWFHWINFPVLGVMIWSGLLIYWANDVYKIKVGGKPLISFFPNTFYEALNIPSRLAEGMEFHFFFMWIFFLNGLAYVSYTIFSGQWRFLVPGKNSLKNAWETVLHDLYIRRKKVPVIKYNGAQQIAYTMIIIMGIGSLLTGLVMYKPIQFSGLSWWLGGYEAARLEHFILTLGYVFFFLIHIMQVIRAGWNNFRGMVTGFTVEKDETKTTRNEKEIV